jgi:bifunctional non-homologous end joining protein LigD
MRYFGLGERRPPGKNAEAACRMGLEGLVSKYRERVYPPGRCDYWVKVKNRKHHTFSRVQDRF